VTSADAHVLLSLLEEMYAAPDLAAFGNRLVGAITRVVPAELAMIREINSGTRSIDVKASTAPEALAGVDRRHAFQLLTRGSPLLASYRQGRGSAIKITDFLTQRQFRHTALYSEFYRGRQGEYQLTKGLPGSPGVIRSLSFLRDRRDFSEPDRLILNRLKTHFIRAYQSAADKEKLRLELDLLQRGLDALESGLIAVSASGTVSSMTSLASRWLTRYFGERALRSDRLPAALQAWLGWSRRSTHSLAVVRSPFVIRGDGGELGIRVVPGAGGSLILLLEERRLVPAVDALRPLGLSSRETEVLAWLTQGKTNIEIASILAISSRTVSKHLEKVYAKLGVENRTAAAARGLETARHAEPSRP
jgi:DNA-binding CsgD family transcriptional regulator